MASPNMNLSIPTVGVTSGPDWASDINSCLTVIDAHDHTNGNGVLITPDGLDINLNLAFNENNAIDLRSLRLTAQSAPLALASDLCAVYASGVDLYYNDGNGNQIRMTASGGVNGSPGSISNLTSPASATYVAASSKFVWQQNVDQAASLDCSKVLLRGDSVSALALTLQPPTVGSNYSITLPTLPNSQKFVTMDASGVMGAPWDVDNSTLQIATSTTLKVKSAGITATQLASDAVTTAKILDANVTRAKLAAANLITSSSCGAFSTTDTSFHLVTNLSTTITSPSGRPVQLMLVPDGSTVAYFTALTGSVSDAYVYWQWLLTVSGGSDVTSGYVTAINSTVVPGGWQMPGPSLLGIATPTANVATTYQFKVRIVTAGYSGTGSVTVNNFRLKAYEL